MLTVLDEANAEDALALLVHEEGCPLDDGWEAVRVHADRATARTRPRTPRPAPRGTATRTCSGPSSARRPGRSRPAAPGSRASREDELLVDDAPRRRSRSPACASACTAPSTTRCGRHRPPPARPARPERYIDATIKPGARGSAGRAASQPDDQPINVEAMEFRADGSLLLGLRYPVTARRPPAARRDPRRRGAVRRPRRGSRSRPRVVARERRHAEAPAGFRALDTRGDDVFDAVIGDLDAADKSATVLEDHPEGGKARRPSTCASRSRRRPAAR